MIARGADGGEHCPQLGSGRFSIRHNARCILTKLVFRYLDRYGAGKQKAAQCTNSRRNSRDCEGDKNTLFEVYHHSIKRLREPVAGHLQFTVSAYLT
jgi:hypothetical protein